MIKNNGKRVLKVSPHHRESKDFEIIYDQACAISGTYPLKSVKAFLNDGILDINGDRISPEDWSPICKALCKKHSLKFIAVRSFWQNKSLGKTSTSKFANKPPSIHTPIIINELVSSLATSLSGTQHITCLELQNVPLHQQEVNILSKSISQHRALQHLSLCQCSIGDEGLEVISKSMKNCFNITSVNLSCCGLTWRGAQMLVSLIKHQTIHRQSEAWRETLRQAIVNLDAMGGLQRITINENRKIGDKGAHILAEILQDPWIKAIDIQNCGIQESGARAFLSALKYNTSLYILDIRNNSIRDHDLLLRISQQLYFNTQGQTSQFKWLNNSTKTKKLAPNSDRNVKKKKSSGIPWRVAERFNSTRHYHSRIPGIANIFHQSIPSLLRETTEEKSDTNSSYSKKTIDSKELKANILTTVEKELHDLRNKILEERTMRKNAELRILKLTEENENLRQSLSKMSLTSLDDSTLDAIETTFMKFNAFIEIVQRMGYSKLPMLEDRQMEKLLNATNQIISASEPLSRCQDSGKQTAREGRFLTYPETLEKSQYQSNNEKTYMNSTISSFSGELQAADKNDRTAHDDVLPATKKNGEVSHYTKSSTSNSNNGDAEQKSRAFMDQSVVLQSLNSSNELHNENANETLSKSKPSSDILAPSSNISTPDTLSGILNLSDKF